MKPLFSIIVPAYNADQYIEECIDSILKQTIDEYEVIIVDDGSTDNTLELCRRIEENYNKIKVFHQNNKGVVFARAKGVKESCGKYLIFCDSDDKIHYETLEAVRNVVHKTNADIITFEMSNDFSQLKRKDQGIYYDKANIVENIFPYLLEDRYGKHFKTSIWGGAYKRELYIANQIENVRIEIGEDLAEIKAMVFNANSLYEMHDILYYYNRNIESVTMRKKVFLWDGPELIGKHIESKIDIDSYDMRKQLDRLVTHQLFLVVKSQFNEKKKYKEIKANILKNLNNDYYQKSIKNCEYSICNLKGNLARVLLKRKLLFLIYMISKIY